MRLIVTFTAMVFLTLGANAQTKQEIRTELYVNVTYPCFLEWADHNHNMAMEAMAMPDVRDTLEKTREQDVRTFMHTESKEDRMDAYLVWKTSCLRIFKRRSIVAPREVVYREVLDHVAIPCAANGRFGGDLIKGAEFVHSHIDKVKKMQDAYWDIVNATESADDRMAAYTILRNFCLK